MFSMHIMVAALLVFSWPGIAFATLRVHSLSCNGYDAEDDRACIQAWIDQAALMGRPERKDLYVPPGTYLYSDLITLRSGVHIRCAGPGASVFKNQGGAGALFVNSEDFATFEDMEDVVIENCGFDVNGSPVNFLSVVNIAPPNAAINIHIRGNRIYDSTIPGMPSAPQRQYILLHKCSNCWVENNYLSEGGRIKVGIPGNQVFIRGNTLYDVNDNAITVVSLGSNASADLHIEDNILVRPLGAGIFFGADGTDKIDPDLATRRVQVARNIITGDGAEGCIIGILPAVAEQVHVVHNLCTKTGVAGSFSRGILITRVNGRDAGIDIAPATDILVGHNTVVATPLATLPNGGIFLDGVQGQLKGVRILGNQVRGDVGGLGIRLRGDIQAAVVAHNIIDGGDIDVDSTEQSFSGIIHDNVVVNAAAPGIQFQATGGGSITVSLRANVIQDPRDGCVSFYGTGIYHVDVVGNTLHNCGGTGPVTFINGAVLAAEAIRVHNIGDSAPHAEPTRHLTASIAWDPGNLPHGASAVMDVPISGVNPGDVAHVGFAGLGAGTWHLSAYVNISNQVRVVLTNQTGNDENPAAGTLRVSVWQLK